MHSQGCWISATLTEAEKKLIIPNEVVDDVASELGMIPLKLLESVKSDR